MKRFVALVFLAMVVIGSCAAQSANNDAQRIVGTWTQSNGTVWVFNANGTGTVGNANFHFAISAAGEIYISGRGWYEFKGLGMSPDGRKMYINGIDWFQKN